MSFYYLIYFVFLCFSRLFLKSKPSFVPYIKYYLSYQRARFTSLREKKSCYSNHSCFFFFGLLKKKPHHLLFKSKPGSKKRILFCAVSAFFSTKKRLLFCIVLSYAGLLLRCAFF